MKKAKLTDLILMLLLLVPVAPPASAILLSLDPDASQINVGDSVTVDLNISGLGGILSLGRFSIDLLYDPVIVLPATANPVTFGTGLNAPPFGLVDNTLPGILHIEEIALGDPFNLVFSQPDAFTLASMTFTGISTGLTGLDFGPFQLFDSFGLEITSLASADPGSIQVTSMPLPHTLLLFGVGMWALFLARMLHEDVG